MMKKKGIAILLTVVLGCASLSGCGGDEKEQTADSGKSENNEGITNTEGTDERGEEKLTFALIPKTLNNPFFVAMADNAQAKADELGVTLEVIAPPQESDIDQQINMFESMLEKDVDGIMVVPNGTKEIVSSVERANEMGIPVVTLDTTAEGGELLCFIGTDNYAGGQMAGEYISEIIDSGQVAMVTGTPGNLTQEERLRGCKEVLEKIDGIEIAGDAVPSYSDRAQAMSQAENLITAYPDLKVIYCVNDEIALGVSEAVQAAGKTDEIKIVGFDGAPEAAQAIIDGEITATLAQQPGRMGELGVEALYEYIVNGTQPEDFTATDCTVADKENAEEYLEWH